MLTTYHFDFQLQGSFGSVFAELATRKKCRKIIDMTALSFISGDYVGFRRK